MSAGLNDQSDTLGESGGQDWTRSFHGLSNEAFSPEAVKALLAPVNPDDIEIKSDGIIYLPEIKYRRILNQAFGPGGWGLAPRGETIVTAKAVTREYALVALGRYGFACLIMSLPEISFLSNNTDSFQSLAASKTTSLPRGYPPQ